MAVSDSFLDSFGSGVVRVSDRAGLLGAVPALLGFHPCESVVLVCLSGSRRRVGPVVRVDLAAGMDPRREAVRVVAVLGVAAARYADEVVVVVYTDDPGRVDTALIRSGLGVLCPVVDVVGVSNASASVSGELAAAVVGAGRAVLASRGELARSVRYRPGVVAPGAVLAELGSVAGRDGLIGRLVLESDPGVVAELVTAVQGTPDSDPRVADLCAVLAVLAYRHGDGALAQVAIDRVLRVAPDHRLAVLLLEAIAAGLPPAALGGVCAAGGAGPA